MTVWSRGDVIAAMARAIAFLELNQLPGGELRVFASDQPDPSVFPTALAAHSLSFAPGAHMVRERALDFLAAEMDARGLWRHWPREHPHHDELPPDLDDTSCASAALERAGRTFPDNRRLLLANRDRRGLFYTWKLTPAQFRHPLALYFFFRKTSAKPFDVDAVVNANVLFYLVSCQASFRGWIAGAGGPDASRRDDGDAGHRRGAATKQTARRRLQDTHGNWLDTTLGAIHETRPVVDHLLTVLREDRETSCDKWYDNPFVVWYFFSRALHDVAPEAGEIIAKKIAAASPENALESALAACSLLYWNRMPDVDSIMNAQLESGGWPRAALYHGGRTRRRDGSFAPPHSDTPRWGSEELTTAFCVEALSRMTRT